jgi:hypothetical protein
MNEKEGFFITIMKHMHCIYINVEPKRKMKFDANLKLVSTNLCTLKEK